MESNLKQTTLSDKLLSIVFIPSALLIILFIFAELTAEITSITKESKTRAQLASLIISTKLESLSAIQNQNKQMLRDHILNFSNTLTQNQLIDEFMLFTPSGTLDYSSSGLSKSTQPELIDVIKTIQIERQKFYQRPKKDRIEIYLPITLNNETAYIFQTHFPIGNIHEALKRLYGTLLVGGCFILAVAIFLTSRLSKYILGPLHQLNLATRNVMAGNFSQKVSIHTGDEIEQLADTFNQMLDNLVIIRERAENANALTHLPGNNAIQAEMNRRIRMKAKFVAVYGDLDNFKAYNDAYGIEKGDQVIQFAANLLTEAVSKHGGVGDFVGHEGGDDFVLITTPAHIEAIASFVTCEFEKRIKSFYTKDDQTKGFVMGRERRTPGQTDDELKLVPFSLVSISLAAISNETTDFANYADVTNQLVDVKHKAKSKKGNSFVWKR